MTDENHETTLSPNETAAVDAANQILSAEVTKKAIIDDVYPWWVTFKRPLYLISVVLFALCAALVILAFAIRGLAIDRENDRQRFECYEAFSNNSSDATARVRASATRVDTTGWLSVLRSFSGEEITQADVDLMFSLVEESEEALELDAQRLVERDAWVADGKPLPCPIQRS